MPYPLNPNYGAGIFRRRIALTRNDSHIDVRLEDCNHAFQLKLFHNDGHVTDIQARAIRHPLSTCPGAADGVRPESPGQHRGATLRDARAGDR